MDLQQPTKILVEPYLVEATNGKTVVVGEEKHNLTGKELLVNQHSYYNNFNKSLFPLGNK
jgi:hypothetical protein